MKLFGYISGENASQKKISMTTPVFMEKDETEVQMRFVIPKEVAVAVTPQPTGERVAIRKRAGGRFAVIRFPGRLSENLAKENEAKLREWMKTKDLTPAEIKPNDPDSNNVESASYDPPFPACHAGFLAAGPRDHVLRIAVAMTESTLHRKLGVEIVC